MIRLNRRANSAPRLRTFLTAPFRWTPLMILMKSLYHSSPLQTRGIESLHTESVLQVVSQVFIGIPWNQLKVIEWKSPFQVRNVLRRPFLITLCQFFGGNSMLPSVSVPAPDGEEDFAFIFNEGGFRLAMESSLAWCSGQVLPTTSHF